VDLDPEVSPPATRRRGQELEDALLNAAWDTLVAGGYASFTIDAVAERAGTSRPVIYRRWKTREELVLAAIRHKASRDSRPVPDTGTLRGDVIALLRQANETRHELGAVLSAQLGAFYSETATTPADLRQQIIGGRTTSMDTIIERAIARGEVDPARLTPRIVALPFDLFRHEALMTLARVPDATMVEIVDEIFLPLVM
jgi:AcrR family transcriptional regulator